jgi:hypothetical protein
MSSHRHGGRGDGADGHPHRSVPDQGRLPKFVCFPSRRRATGHTAKRRHSGKPASCTRRRRRRASRHYAGDRAARLVSTHDQTRISAMTERLPHARTMNRPASPEAHSAAAEAAVCPLPMRIDLLSHLVRLVHDGERPGSVETDGRPLGGGSDDHVAVVKIGDGIAERQAPLGGEVGGRGLGGPGRGQAGRPVLSALG